MGQQEAEIKKLAERIAIATTTLYKPNVGVDVHRAKLATDSIKTATMLGYEVIVVDGGSSDEVLEEFRRYGARVYPEKERGMGKSRRQAIRLAHDTGKEVIAWTEPEKTSYMREILKTAKPIIDGSADLVVPKRRSLESYPIAQQLSEPFGNLFWKELTGHALDMLFGPRTWNRRLSDYFLSYDGRYGDEWDSIFIPVMNAIFDGKGVIGVEVEYTHPKEQKEGEEHDINFYKKRLLQLENLLPAFEAHWGMLHKK